LIIMSCMVSLNYRNIQLECNLVILNGKLCNLSAVAVEALYGPHMSDSIAVSTEYRELLDSVKQAIAAGRLRVARTVNTVLVETYWKIVQDIVTRQRGEQCWGARVIEHLSVDLRVASQCVRGLSVRNLQYMTTLASRWPTGIAQQPAAQLGWGHIMTLLDSCPDDVTCDFYARRAAAEGWSRAALQAMIASGLRDRHDRASWNARPPGRRGDPPSRG
jgi:hypothetical protein